MKEMEGRLKWKENKKIVMGMQSLLLPIVEEQKLLVWVWMIRQLGVGRKDGKDWEENDEEGKDEDRDGNVLTITFDGSVKIWWVKHSSQQLYP